MRTEGGSFVRALGLAVEYADPDSYARLQSAFPELFKKYGEIAEELKRKDDELP